jgi:hypothetical protein
MRRFFQRFVKGLELVVEKGAKILGVYKAVKETVKETVKYVAAKISPAVKSMAGKACVYLKTTGLSSLSSPMCLVQAASPYVIAVVGTLAVSAVVFSTIGALAG